MKRRVALVLVGVVVVTALTIKTVNQINELKQFEAERKELWNRLDAVQERINDLQDDLDDASSILLEVEQYDQEKLEWVWQNREFLEDGE